MEVRVIRSALPINKPSHGKRATTIEYEVCQVYQQNKKENEGQQQQQHRHLVEVFRCRQSRQIKCRQRRRRLLQCQLQQLQRQRQQQEQQSSIQTVSLNNVRNYWNLNLIALLAISTGITLLMKLQSTSCVVGAERMVRLCIASVDPVKLSSQCVMCNRREFPLTVIDCTGITKVNDLIANPLSVQEATCLIYNCRRQVPNVKPEPYHGSVSHAANYRGAAASNYPPPPSSTDTAGPSATGSRIYEMMSPSGMFGGGYSMGAMQPNGMHPQSPFMSGYQSGYGPYMASGGGGTGPMYSAVAAMTPKGLIGGPSFLSNRHRGPLSYALVPAPSFPFGSRKHKMALMPLFR